MEIKRHIHRFFFQDSFGAQIDANLSLDLLNILKPIHTRARVLISVDPRTPSCMRIDYLILPHNVVSKLRLNYMHQAIIQELLLH